MKSIAKTKKTLNEGKKQLSSFLLFLTEQNSWILDFKEKIILGRKYTPSKSISDNSIVTVDGLTNSERSGCLTRGYFRSSLSCDEYFVCAKGRRHKFRCQEGLYFDEALKLCNWKKYVKCSSSKKGKLQNSSSNLQNNTLKS